MESAADKIVQGLTFSETYGHFTGLDDDTQTVPNVICTASETGEEIPPNSGNRIVKLRVTINANASDISLDNFRADAEIMTNAFRVDNIGDTLSGHEDAFYVYDPPKTMQEGAEPKDGKFTKHIELDLLACEVDV
jgi:hypothetical protein